MSRIILFGATGGIGSALARRLRPQHDLFLCARGEERLRALAGDLDCPWKIVDATRFAEVEAAFDQAKALGAPLAGAANCVGSIVLKPAHLTSEGDFDETVSINLKTAFAVTRAAGKHMGAGSVVLFASVAGFVGLANHEAISAAKAGVAGLARSAAATYASRRLRFNVVAPGLVDTPLAARITGNPKALQASEAMHPLGRIANPEEVAEMAAWLLSEAQSFITGQVFSIDGGMSTVRGR